MKKITGDEMGTTQTPARTRTRAVGQAGLARLPAVPRRVAQCVLAPPTTMYTRRELPRFRKVLRYYGTLHQPDWARAEPAEMRDRFFRMRMRLDMDDFYQRLAFFFGSYHELDVLSAIHMGLRKGDAFIDGGANIGLVTLFAAGIVGAHGRVDAFEPNPAALERLRWHVKANALGHVNVHPNGLGAGNRQTPVHLPDANNLASATLGSIPARYGQGTKIVGTTTIVRGDDALDTDDRSLFLKLDVEGFEMRALLGLERTIQTRRPPVVIEINNEMLTVNGSSPAEVVRFFANNGYEPFAMQRLGWRHRHALHLIPTPEHRIAKHRDVLFLCRDAPHWKRFAQAIRPVETASGIHSK